MAIQLFWADLDMPPYPYEALAESLSATERARAARYPDLQTRRRWVTARGLLRHGLARRTGVEPRALPLATSPRGKPHLADGPSFNLSYSGVHLLIGVAPRGRVGVDVEMRCAMTDLDALANACCTPREAAAILALPDAPPDRDRTAAFFRTWVCKEAILKAVGTGITASPAAFEMRHDGGQGNRVARVRCPGEQQATWRVHAVPAPAGAEAALAWDSPELEPAVVPWLE